MNWTKDDAREAGRRGGLAKARKNAAPELAADQVSQQSAAVQARWAAERGSEEEVTDYFKRGIAVDDGLQLLARMRKNCELASYALNARITADNDRDRCEFCGGAKKPRKQWALVSPFRDPSTMLVRNLYYCSIECVALRNRRDQGVYGVPDRGMTQAMNPKFHPEAQRKGLDEGAAQEAATKAEADAKP